MRALWALVVWAAAFGVKEVAREDAPLEPSIRNEVDHAIARGEAWLARLPPGGATNGVCAASLFATNGLSPTALALRLVSAQKGAGWWLTPTNAAPTRAAVRLLKGL